MTIAGQNAQDDDHDEEFHQGESLLVSTLFPQHACRLRPARQSRLIPHLLSIDIRGAALKESCLRMGYLNSG